MHKSTWLGVGLPSGEKPSSKNKLVMHGRLHIATDWRDYANHIRELGNGDLGLINLAGNNNFSPRPLWRTETRYELRGKKLDHEVWDLCYGLK